MTPVSLFTFAFLFALTTSVVLRAWLAVRQLHHVAAHRELVPFDFAASVPLADHRKAADYTVTKIRHSLTVLAV
ncbi:MAG TPA: M48 family peptidase, partial [Rhodocyclaceae bacterium]|nr:M48 family peptidase [Rhodocyclaceae bacterium]